MSTHCDVGKISTPSTTIRHIANMPMPPLTAINPKCWKVSRKTTNDGNCTCGNAACLMAPSPVY